MKAVMATIVTRAVALSHADAGAIYRYEPSRGVVEIAESQGLDASFLDAAQATRMRLDGSPLGSSLKKRKVVLVPDLSKETRFPHRANMLAAGFNAATAAAALEIDRHTVQRHLRKVEEALGRLLPSCHAELEVALSLEELDDSII